MTSRPLLGIEKRTLLLKVASGLLAADHRVLNKHASHIALDSEGPFWPIGRQAE